MNTTIITPRRGNRYSYDESDAKARTEFEQAIIAKLELPNDWNKYFRFSSSDDYITLQEDKSYDYKTFRRFARGKVAILPVDLRSKLIDHMEERKKIARLSHEKQEREEMMREKLEVILGPIKQDGFRYHYRDERFGLTVYLLDPNNPLHDNFNVQAEANIMHDGTIKPPSFLMPMRYSATIKDIHRWLAINQPLHDKVMNKAWEVTQYLMLNCPEFFTEVNK